MKLSRRDWMMALGAFLLAVGPELQTESESKAEWRAGRWMRILGVGMMGISRAIGTKQRDEDDQG